jgi:tRNA U34 2-thiouridine synthase MnmA/TrmU
MTALALLSGGLDSLLAAKLIQKQGIEVIGLHFLIPFSKDKSSSLSGAGIKIEPIDIRREFLGIIKAPPHGFGSQLNPCIDCKISMLKRTKELLPAFGAQFVITGEVLGQRPMSQHRKSLRLIEEESGLSGLLLRPLCAKLLPETVPEQKDWVKRDRLLGFSGRGRRQQIRLAREFGMEKYAQPAGGCLLTDPKFTLRLTDLLAHHAMDIENIELLKLGRHFRLSPKTKLVVGRNQEENEKILSLAEPDDFIFMPTQDLAGPTALGRGVFDNEMISLSCGIVARYCDLDGEKSAAVVVKQFGSQQESILESPALAEERILALRI